VVLFHKLSTQNAKALADKIRKGVEKEYFIHGDRELRVTVSLGVSSARIGGGESALFERADRAMYTAKKKGRNRVEIES
jgi:diguanylate cyclase (GGDEF)-like protein